MGFPEFLAEIEALCVKLRDDLKRGSDRGRVLRRARQGLAMLDNAQVHDEGDVILHEIAREDLLDIIRQAGG